MKNIYFKNSHGQKLCGGISTTNSDTAILFCHGLGRNKDDKPFISLREEIVSSGITTLRLDLLGHGCSEGEFDDLTLTETIDDILCAKHELETRGYTEIGFIGSSFGAVGGIMAASTEQFKFLVLISPPTHYNINEMITSGIDLWKELKIVNKNTKKEKAHFHIRFFKDYGSYDSYVAAEKIFAPVLILQGDKDKIVPLAKSRELNRRIKDSKIEIFRGADHHYSKSQNRLIEEVMKFVRRTCNTQTEDSLLEVKSTLVAPILMTN